MKIIDHSTSDFEASFAQILGSKQENNPKIDAVVQEIITTIIQKGDDALVEYSSRFDRIDLSHHGIEIKKEEIDHIAEAVPEDLKSSIDLAAKRIRHYHEQQKPMGFQYQDDIGATLGMRWTSIQSAGLYVPGGTASYPSSVLMNAIPAKVAGVARLAMVVPTPDGIINPLVLYAAKIAGVDEVFRVGGAQAVAALAYGTETIKPVDIIVGPGNAYVAAAKRQVFGKVGIDMVAGPSEVMIIASSTANPEWVAADLIAQAEHDTDAQCVLICDDQDMADQVQSALERQLPLCDRSDIAQKSLTDNGFIIIVADVMESGPLIDRYAPEHLQLIVEDCETLLSKFSNAGAIFLGAHTPTAMGDYITGPNHVLPTGQTARFASGLSVYDFMKRSTICALNPEGFSAIAPSAVKIAKSEGLDGHAKSISIRTNAF